jgi:CelD/BcsL family acetyltransferase involved in cellulose biosynthesis
VNIELYTTPAVFNTLRGEWDALLSPNRSTDLFMTHAWQRTWWKHLGRGDLAIVTVRDGEGKLIGIGPWFIEETGGQRIVRTIGCEAVADYLSPILQPGAEERATAALLQFMLSDQAPAWDLFELCNMPDGSPALEWIPEIAKTCGLITEIEHEDVCPVIDLPDTYEAYLDSLDKKQRHELRRKRRRAEEHGVNCYVVGPERNLDDEIEAFLVLMAHSTAEKSKFLEERGHRAFFREIGKVMFDLGHLDLLFLTIDGQRAAAMWQFSYQDRMMLYNSGLNPSAFAALSPGIVLLTFSVEDAIRKGFKKYDFLQGDEDYKFRMGANPITVHNLIIRRK